jgi:hypothetical protein
MSLRLQRWWRYSLRRLRILISVYEVHAIGVDAWRGSRVVDANACIITTLVVYVFDVEGLVYVSVRISCEHGRGDVHEYVLGRSLGS